MQDFYFKSAQFKAKHDIFCMFINMENENVPNRIKIIVN